MMYLSARRRVFKPFRSLGFGLVGIGRRLGSLLGGSPIANPSGGLDSSIGLDIGHLIENFCASVVLYPPELEFFCAM